ncbi:protein SRG1 [Setaria italica]|nr:protein SRG1 [Setaria italica]XP_034570479.1 protein SRG1-like [Setaria viridis]
MEARNYDKVVNRDEITDATASAFADGGQIPEKYIRTEEVLDGVVVGDDESYELPVVDMARLLDPESSALEIAKLGDACRNWGFFQLTNHGADEGVVQRMKDSTVQFFSTPLESKKKVAVREKGFEGFGHHYSRASSGHKLDWAESVILITQPPQDRKMEMWPTNPPTFREALEVYSVEMIGLAERLLGFMAADLGVERAALLDAFTGRRQSMAIHYYPPCRHREKVMGITPHTDGLGLTLLLHVDDTPGLQIRKGGRWFPVRPLPGAFVVNVADILEVLSNGAYRSVEHRVIPDAERARTTVVIFQEAAVGGMVAPLSGLVAEGGGEARYKSIEVEEYIKGNFNALMEGTRFIDSLRI